MQLASIARDLGSLTYTGPFFGVGGLLFWRHRAVGDQRVAISWLIGTEVAAAAVGTYLSLRIGLQTCADARPGGQRVCTSDYVTWLMAPAWVLLTGGILLIKLRMYAVVALLAVVALGVLASHGAWLPSD